MYCTKHEDYAPCMMCAAERLQVSTRPPQLKEINDPEPILSVVELAQLHREMCPSTTYGAEGRSIMYGQEVEKAILKKMAEGAAENKANEDIQDVAWIKRRERNDLAKEAMKLIIEKSPFVVSVNDNKDWVFKAVADGAYAYADAMQAASGAYDEDR